MLYAEGSEHLRRRQVDSREVCFLPKYFNVSQFARIQLKASLISSVVEYCLSLGKLTYVQTKQLRGNCLSAKQPRVVCLTISDIDRDVSVA